jgi:hypothetical protein
MDGVPVSYSRGYYLPTAGISRHKVGFDQSCHYFYIGFRKTPINNDGNASACFSKVYMGLPISGEMILDSYVMEDIRRTDDIPKFISLVGAMKTGRNQNADIFPGDASSN